MEPTQEDINRGTSGNVAVVIGIFTATVPTILLALNVTYLFVIPLLFGLYCIFLGFCTYRTKSKLGLYSGWFALIIGILATGVPMGVLAHDRATGYPISIVVPVGYRGPVRLIIDGERGQAVPLTDGWYRYRILENGTRIIKDSSPFNRWHTERMIYANGEIIPSDHENNQPPEVVTCRSLGYTSRSSTTGEKQEYMEYFVGTRKDLEGYYEQLRKLQDK